MYMPFMTLAMLLINKASDGRLTLDEITECVQEVCPGYCVDVHEAVQEARQDGEITVWEVFKILTVVIA